MFQQTGSMKLSSHIERVMMNINSYIQSYFKNNKLYINVYTNTQSDFIQFHFSLANKKYEAFISYRTSHE